MASAYLSSLVSISLVLFLVGAASLLLVNAKGVSDYFKKNVKISVILKTGVTEDQATEYQKGVDAATFSASSEFISRERGEEELKALLGEDFLEVFETSPVPLSVEVAMKPEYVSPDSVKVASSILGNSPLVDEVVWQQTLVEALSYNLGRASAIISILILLLLFISFVLIANTVRLDLFSRRFSIHTMHLVGATKGYIRAPFMGRAAIQGLFAALLAILLLVGGLYILRDEFPQLFQIFSAESLLQVMAVMIVSGVVICMVSTYFMVGRLVGYNRDQLYAY